ncbi:isoleucine--tRNA ligase [Candidatus Woesearchaeota archaeon]|nr:isoleucine--tRNA ligase [Candidatus Woesearchaeota archaeon]
MPSKKQKPASPVAAMKPVTIGDYQPVQAEEAILKHWVKEQTYEWSKDKTKKGPAFYFLDGPPYTSGRVHIGTAWNKALKDMVLRHKRMQGFNVWDRAGYDMHGLPSEHATEKKLGIKGKAAIEKYGVEKFVEACRQLSVDNMLVMNQDFERMGVWMDFDNAYQSIKKEFIEGVWWVIKKAHENNRLYEGLRTMTWCASCATVIAKHELEYEDVTENSIFVKFPVLGEENLFLVIWTTTPWTIPFNLAVMVHPELDYVECAVDASPEHTSFEPNDHETDNDRKDNNGTDTTERWIVARALAGPLIQSVAGRKYTIIKEMKGAQLEGRRYQHPLAKDLPFLEELRSNPKLHTVLLSAEYVGTDAGSGIVHAAPGCGPEDYEVGHRNGLPPVNHLNENGVFENCGPFTGIRAKQDDTLIIDALKKEGALLAETSVTHSYPHCQRCHKPVIFRATRQWFFRVEDLKEEMIKENNKIRWVPDAAYNAFNSWLEHLRDNSITKQRYWGTPLPVWRCGKCANYVVVGSVKELVSEGADVPKDLHRPWIDEVTIKCGCGGVKKRIPDIIDVWVDAGSASWNCLDYPHTEKNFKKLFPADFILEGKDQIRGWFNLLHVASIVALKKPSFRNVYMHGFVQDALGRKMSKSLGNYILPEEVISKYGADTLRYYTIGGANPAVDLNYNFEDMKLKHNNLRVLWNLHKLVIDNAILLGVNPEEIKREEAEASFKVEERYILSVLNSTIRSVTGCFNAYLLNEIPWKIERLYLELSRTYIQLIREKLATGEDDEKKAVVYVLYRVLLETMKLFAPAAPFITESMYLNFKNAFGLEEASIHHYSWPKEREEDINVELEPSLSRPMSKAWTSWSVLTRRATSSRQTLLSSNQRLAKRLPASSPSLPQNRRRPSCPTSTSRDIMTSLWETASTGSRKSISSSSPRRLQILRRWHSPRGRYM